MTHKRARPLLPLWHQASRNTLAFGRYGIQWQELALNSVTTIGLRVVGWQSSSPTTANRLAEDRRMWQEKQDALNQAVIAWAEWQGAWLREYWRQCLLTPTQRQGDRLLMDMNRWTRVWLAGATAMLHPYHSRAAGNARRLARRS